MPDTVTLLRQYETWECGREGYPLSWDHRSAFSSDGCRYYNLPNAQSEVENCGPIVTRHPPIKDLIREQAGHRCLRCQHPYTKGEHGNGEWSPCDERCTHGGPHRWRFTSEHPEWKGDWLYGEHAEEPWPVAWTAGLQVEAKWRILTVHHLDGDKANCRWWNLAALCQRCHLRMQRAVVMGRPYHFEHSAWFRPFAAGFYGWKYLGEDLSREEVMERMDELLALEHRFTQEAIF